MDFLAVSESEAIEALVHSELDPLHGCKERRRLTLPLLGPCFQYLPLEGLECC